MISHRSLASKFLPALILGLCTLPAPAQAHPELPPERPKIDSERVPDPTTGKLPGNGNLSPQARDAAKDAFNRPKVVLWKKTGSLENYHQYRAFEVDQSGGAERPLSLQGLDNLYKSGSPVVNTGDMPRGEDWRKYVFSHSDQVVIHEKASANRDPAAVAHATELAARPLDRRATRIFNALPQETDPASSFLERTRMGIGGSQAAWQTMNAQIKSVSRGFASQVADKKALLDELHYGSASVVVIYAHFDGTRLYLPGSNGDSLSVEEIARVDRTRDPAARERVIILAACSTAHHFSTSGSLTSVLLEKGIARTVLATDQPYDARVIPDLMARLAAGTPIREAGGQLLQHVELRNPGALPGQPPLRRAAGEGLAGE